MIKKLILIIALFITTSSFSQKDRDRFILDSIEPFINNINLTKAEYYKIKKAIQKIESKNGYEPDYKFRLLSKSYTLGDIDFFKKELTILVEKYGFSIAYLNENESYFNSITNGDLKEWFKEMYLKKHFVWLQNNFDKQIDLKKLNELRTKDQLINSFASKIINTCNLDSIQKKAELKLLNESFYSNINDLYNITQKWSAYPNGKSFAIIQNNFGVVEFHNNQSKANFNKVWQMFYPYYKKAYKNNEITYMTFRNHDNFSYLHHGYQEFGLISIKDIPTEYKKTENEIPIKDINFMNEIKLELGW